MTATDVTLQPRFLGGEGSRHFTLTFESHGAARGHIVFLPPFAEEMNRCRALVAQQARAFCALGYHCTLIDFFGTGDSEGELADARLAHWQQNIDTTIDTITSQSALPVTLWGLRTGALIAADYASRTARDIQHILMWQPVTSGKRYVVQLLRQRVASLANSGLPAETTAQIRQRLGDGQTVEVSGYVLGGGIVADLESLTLSDTTPRCAGSVFWLEHADSEGEPLSAGAQKAVDKLAQGSTEVQVHTFSGAPVWQLHKRDHAPRLLEISTGLFSRD
ncbi:MAG: hydrolase 2, exosortase A system-associated [Gammaproteobacteria bacterium]|nr:hydrolase 2, exosortase A system-associated [Gammaproteobacteria bacterium]